MTPIEQEILEARVNNTEMLLLMLVSALRTTQPLTVQQEIDRLMDEYESAAESLGYCDTPVFIKRI